MVVSTEYRKMPEFRYAPMRRYPLGASKELWYLAQRESSVVLNERDIRCLLLCDEFRSLQGHASEILKKTWIEGTAEHLVERLASFVAIGCLVGKHELLSRESDVTDHCIEDTHRITSLVVPTCNRPHSLQRAVRSYIRNATRFNRPCRIVVLDDSAHEGDRAACKQALATECSRSGFEGLYFGVDEKAHYRDELVRRGLPAGMVSFALDHSPWSAISTGANRNFALMLTAGELIMSVDDDTICAAADAFPDRPRSIAFGCQEDLEQYWFFHDRGAAIASPRPLELDFFAEHNRVLGLELHKLCNDSAHLVGACDKTFLDLYRREARILVTTNGLCGDCGMSNLPAPTFEGETRTRTFASAESFALLLSAREMVRQTRCVSLNHLQPTLMTYTAGIDNRNVIPPFFPFGRYEDAVFGYLLGKALPQSYMARLPFTIQHTPEMPRQYNSNCPEAEVHISQVLIECMSSWTAGSGGLDIRAALISLGSHLKSVGALDPRRFREMVRSSFWAQASRQISLYLNMLDRYNGQPEYWASELNRRIGIMQNAVAAEGYGLPLEISRCGSDAEAWHATQGAMYQFGELLCCWPEFIKVANELRQVGRKSQGAGSW